MAQSIDLVFLARHFQRAVFVRLHTYVEEQTRFSAPAGQAAGSVGSACPKMLATSFMVGVQRVLHVHIGAAAPYS